MIKKIGRAITRPFLILALMLNISVGTMFLLAGVATLPVVTMAPACSKNELVANAEDVLSSLQQVSALLPNNSVLQELLPKATQLIAAIKASDKTTALAL